MGEELAVRLVAGFNPATLILMTLVAIVAALLIRRWEQIYGAALFAFAADCIGRYFLLLGAAEGVPANFAMGLAITRLDDGAISAMLRPFLYLAIIAALYAAKRRYGAR